MPTHTKRGLKGAGVALAAVVCAAAFSASATVPMMRNQMALSADARAQLRARAEGGDADAQMDMGELYSNWAGQRPNFIEAIKWYRLAAAHPGWWDRSANEKIAALQARIDAHKRLYAQAQDGDGQHLYDFALDLPHGAAGIDGDVPMPHWMLKSAEAGHTQAQLTIGTLYFRAAFARKSKAYDEVRAATEYVPHPFYVTERAYGYDPIGFDDETPEHDLPNAITWLAKAADAGDAQAEYNLGMAYAASGPTQDVARARLWLHRGLMARPLAALQPWEKAMVPPTACELDFSGTLRKMPVGWDANDAPVFMIAVDDKPDYPAAYACYDHVKATYPVAYLYLGKMLHRGQGVARDDARAMAMLDRARTTVFEPDALYEMSLVYRDSHTIARDPVRAYILMTRAIEKIKAWRAPACGEPSEEALQANRWELRTEMEADQKKLYAHMSKPQRRAADNELKREHVWPGHGPETLEIIEPVMPCV